MSQWKKNNYATVKLDCEKNTILPQCNEAAEKNIYATPNEAVDKKGLCHNVMNESAEKTIMPQCHEPAEKTNCYVTM